MKILIILVLLFSVSCDKPDSTIILGKIKTFDSRNPDSVNIKVIRRTSPWDSTNTIKVKNKDQYKITFKGEESEMFFFVVSSPGFQEINFPIFNDEDEIDIDIVLAENQSSNLSYLKPKNSDTRNSKFSNIYQKVIDDQKRIRSAYKKHIEKTGDFENFYYDVTENCNFIRNSLNNEKDIMLRDFLYISFFNIYYMGNPKSLFKKDFAQTVLKEVAPSSPIWSLNYNAYALNNIVFVAAKPNHFNYNKTLNNYIDRLLSENSDPELKSHFLYERLENAKRRNDMNTYNDLYYTLVNDFSKTTYGRKTRAIFKSNFDELKIKPGEILPAFKFVSLEDSSFIYTNDYFKGKIYLLDFWATWCSPCIKDIPFQEEVYKKFKNRGFDILSISWDQRKEDIQDYRQSNNSMPWHHVLLKGDKLNKSKLEFEVYAIPKAILIDRSGKIIVVDDGLHREDLLKTISNLMADRN